MYQLNCQNDFLSLALLFFLRLTVINIGNMGWIGVINGKKIS
jgi:hypothetical protein